jgi:ankyrin repeat protein
MVAMKFYLKINSTIEEILLSDITEAKFRLRHAVINNNLLFVAIFLRHTGEVDAMDESKQSFIHWSTTAAMIHLLLSYGANLHHLAISGRTALHNCSTVEAAEALLKAGLSPHILNTNHGSPLHNGFMSTGITRTLLKHGADPNIVNYYGHTPLHLVASRGTW